MLDGMLAQIPSHSLHNTWFVLWVSSFVFALVLALPPSQLKRWRRYLIAFVFYVLIQVVFFMFTITVIKRAADVDDGASLMLVPGLMALPSILMLFLLSFRGLVWLARILWRYVGIRDASSS